MNLLFAPLVLTIATYAQSPIPGHDLQQRLRLSRIDRLKEALPNIQDQVIRDLVELTLDAGVDFSNKTLEEIDTKVAQEQTLKDGDDARKEKLKAECEKEQSVILLAVCDSLIAGKKQKSGFLSTIKNWFK